MPVHPARYQLPVAFSTEIGRIITRWAFVEWRLRETVYVLLRLDPKRGRIAVREPRAREYVTMIQDLCRLSGIKTTTDLKALGKLVDECATYRNQFAHGVWINHPDSKDPVLQSATTSYIQSPAGYSAKGRIEPVALFMDVTTLRRIRKGIDTTALKVQRLRKEIVAALDE